jgi:N-formylglutamate amidohydrolase
LPEANNALPRCSASIVVLNWDEIVHEPSLSEPIVLPPCGDHPVLLSVPHSGRDYPDWLVAMSAVGKSSLSSLEDPLVDRLIWRAVQSGCGAVIARAPRAAIDCNRAEDEVDPSVIEGARRGAMTARARGGLGIVPARTQQHGYLWRRAITCQQLDDRIQQAHRPYHLAIEEQLAQLFERFGCALLLDCHSMPPAPFGVAEVVIGNCRGRTADFAVSQDAVEVANCCGFTAGLNDPFAGGHVIERHARPALGIHALQIELDRRCYLDEALRNPGPGFDRAAMLLQALAVNLGQTLLGRQFATAAE